MAVYPLASLRYDAVRRHPLHPGPVAPPDRIARYESSLREWRQRGGLTILGPEHAPRAYVGWVFDPHDPGMGVPTGHMNCDWKHGDDEARDWVFGTLRDTPQALGEHALAHVDAHRPELRDLLFELGLGIDSVMLTGETRVGLQNLGEPCFPDDLIVRPLETDDIEPFLDLQEQVFRSNPEFCWFGGTPEFRETTRRNLTDGRAGRDSRRWTVLDGQGVAGVFSCDHGENPMWGPMGGMYFCFHPRIRGRRLTHAAYHLQLGALAEAGIELYRGSTAQLPIIAMAKRMGRRLTSWNMRRGTHFAAEYFDVGL